MEDTSTTTKRRIVPEIEVTLAEYLAMHKASCAKASEIFTKSQAMTSAQYKAALSSFGISQAEAAKLLHIGERTSKRWAAQGVEGPAAILLRLLLAGKLTIDDIRKLKP